MPYNYASEKTISYRQKAEALADTMPPFLHAYLRSKAASAAASTQLAYTYDIADLLRWWHNRVPALKTKSISEMSIDDISKMTNLDINDYLYSLTSTQNAKTLARKCTAFASMFQYLVNQDELKINPMDKVERPKIRKDLRIVKLEHDEVQQLLNAVEHGCPGMPEHQKKYLEGTKARDLAIITLMLTTGIRVSECTGLDISDIFFQSHQMQITRKGGKKQTLALSDKACSVLEDYLVIRKNDDPSDPKDKNALFLSTRKTRLCPAAIENMVSKYTTALGFGKRITPHKLRKTYGTNLYNETRDIYLVANALGHENVNTTTQHYVATREEDLQDVRNVVAAKIDKGDLL